MRGADHSIYFETGNDLPALGIMLSNDLQASHSRR